MESCCWYNTFPLFVIQIAALRPPPVPYIYQTPGGQEIDLRLFNKGRCNIRWNYILKTTIKCCYSYMFDCSDRINKKNMFAKNGLEKFEFHWIWHYLFKTLNHIIFAVFVPDLINNCLPILGSILERGARGWHVQYRQKMMRDLQGQWSYIVYIPVHVITTRTWSQELEYVFVSWHWSSDQRRCRA